MSRNNSSIDDIDNVNNITPSNTGSKDNGEAVTLNDIAERCGVTKATVSRALSGKQCISKTMIAKVLKTAAELGYNPAQNDAARRLSFKKSGHHIINHVIALFWPPHTYQSEYFGPLHQHIIDELAEQNYAVLTLYFQRQERLLPRVFDRGDVDAAIIFGRHWGRFSTYKQLRDNPGFGNRPLVSLTTKLFDSAVILADEEEGVRSTIETLISLGHSHFLHYTYQQLWGMLEPDARIKTVEKVLTEHGLDPKTHLHLLEINKKSDEPQPHTYYLDAKQLVTTQDIINDTSDNLLKYLQQHPEITAILSLNDANAIHSWLALQQAGFSIPDDFSIVGFDDTTALLNQDGENLLSSVRLPLSEMGTAAAQLAIAQVNNGKASTEHVLLPTNFIRRASVGKARELT